MLQCPDCSSPITIDPDTHAPPKVCEHCGHTLNLTLESDLRPAVAELLHFEEIDASDDSKEAVANAEAIADTSPVPEPVQDATVSLSKTAPASTFSSRKEDPKNATASSGPAAMPVLARSRKRSTLWPGLVVALLTMLLMLQILLADRARLAENPRWRPLLTQLCGVFQCTLPPWREPEAFTMLERSVAPLDDHPGVLHVRATFRNDAQWAQPWPGLQLSLADADGRVVASRILPPPEYLGQHSDRELAKGQSAQVDFLVREPEAHVVSFLFAFH